MPKQVTDQTDRTDPTEIRVIANMVVGADGCTTLNGSSAGLSSPEDRIRFHALRTSADYIVIGGNTARKEPYLKTPVPLIVLTRGELPQEVAPNPRASKFNGPIREVLATLRGVVLIEAGPAIVTHALNEKLIDELHVTLTKNTTGENCINLIEITDGYKEIFREVVGNEEFITFTPLK